MIDLQRLLQDDSVDTTNEDEWATWRIAISFSAAALCLIMSVISIFVIVTIVMNPGLRSFTFHIYVIFILAPDAFLNAVDGAQSIYRGIYDGKGPTGLCFARNFFLIFYYYSNICVNACVATEVYTLIWRSYHRKRTKPPTLRKLFTQVGISYGIAAAISCWMVIPWGGSLLTVSNEPVCMYTFGSEQIPFMVSMLVTMILTVPLLVYVFWVGYTVKTQNLLPVRGKTRALALFFFRIVVNFFVFYTPMFIMAMFQLAAPPEDQDSTPLFALYLGFSILVPIQNIVTIKFLSEKEDIAAGLWVSCDRILSVFSSRPSVMIVANSEWFMEDTYEDGLTSVLPENSDIESETFEYLESGYIDSKNRILAPIPDSSDQLGTLAGFHSDENIGSGDMQIDQGELDEHSESVTGRLVPAKDGGNQLQRNEQQSVRLDHTGVEHQSNSFGSS